jgi:hypothetical protein
MACRMDKAKRVDGEEVSTFPPIAMKSRWMGHPICLGGVENKNEQRQKQIPTG